ncbi:uncharacterized protein LOC109838334 [Asparagus officinalis]|uniref:uncharacterized protein LOC109838334 n=1 Tax=Asparagus officinalis TaxID=4686 RepID=UPI00098DF1B0|nr:uncharacterized protein LOC109838334 [Asparagus officinalis]
MTFLFCKWLIAANIVTRRRRISDSEEEIAPRQATEVTREAVMSPRGKEAAESSRKGKEPALPVDSEEEFDSEATETSEGEDENESSSEEVSGLPDSFFDRGLVRPSVAPTQPQAAPKKRKERVVMEHPNRMTVEVLSCDEEDEEDMVPLIRRQISRTSTQAQTQVSPRAELRTKHRHEGSGARPLKKQKKAVSKPRVHLPAVEETSGRSVSSDEQGSREEGELSADAASPGGMEIEETSFVQQMHDALKEGSADVPPTPDVDPSAVDTGLRDQRWYGRWNRRIHTGKGWGTVESLISSFHRQNLPVKVPPSTRPSSVVWVRRETDGNCTMKLFPGASLI